MCLVGLVGRGGNPEQVGEAVDHHVAALRGGDKFGRSEIGTAW